MKKYDVYLSVMYGHLTVDDVEAENEDDAYDKAVDMVIEEMGCAKLTQAEYVGDVEPKPEPPKESSSE